MEKTLSIIKPDAIQKKVIGKIITHLEENSFKIIAFKMVHLTEDQAKKFYEVHKEKPFYNDLVKFMSSAPIIAMCLEGENAISKLRELMGITDSKKAIKGTIRNVYGTDIQRNAIHGSDRLETAQKEIKFFFPNLNLS